MEQELQVEVKKNKKTALKKLKTVMFSVFSVSFEFFSFLFFGSVYVVLGEHTLRSEVRKKLRQK